MSETSLHAVPEANAAEHVDNKAAQPVSVQQLENSDVVSIEVDGIEMSAAKGSMLIEATDVAGVEVPRFCYHSKLSIAANCRMCLVDVEG